MTKRRDVLIAATTTVATIILTGVVITAILLLAIFITDPSPMKSLTGPQLHQHRRHRCPCEATSRACVTSRLLTPSCD